MPDILKPDLCIVSAGALGRSLAVAARQRGLETVLIERENGEAGDLPGGTLHRTTLRAVAAQAQAIRTGARLGLENALPKLNYKAIAEHAEAVAASAAPQTSPDRLVALGVTLLEGTPAFTDKNTLSVGQSVLKPAHTILATGSTPAVPDLPGLGEIAFFTPDTILSNVRKLTHLLIVGGNETALELAQIYRRLGSDVTLVAHGSLLADYDTEGSAILRRHLREEGLAILENARVKAFLPRSQGIGVSLDDADGHIASLDVSHVLIATGIVPDLPWAALENAGLKRQTGAGTYLQLNEQGRTSHGRISAFGGAAGEPSYHRSLRQGEQLLDRLSGMPAAAIDGLPRAVATQPELAQIGMIDGAEASKLGHVVLRANLGESEAARAVGLAWGSAKIVVDRQGKILGGTMVGEGAADTIANLALAMSRNLHAADLASLPIVGTGNLAVLAELGGQWVRRQKPSNWSKRRGSLRRLLP